MRRRGKGLLLVLLSSASAGTAFAEPRSPMPAVQAATTAPAAFASGLPTEQEMAVQVLAAGSSAKMVREQARRSIPWAKLTAEQQKTATLVLSDVGLFRRLPTVRCPIDPKTYQYFIESPDVAVSLWRVLGISRLQLKKTAPGIYQADTGDGSSGTVQVMLQTPSQCVAFCDGMFKSPLLTKPIKARTLVVLNATYETKPDGTSEVTHTVDMFVSFPSVAVETIAKLVSPLSYKFADRNMEEITSFLRMMDLSMARQPVWVEQIAQLLDGVDAQQREQLVAVTGEVRAEAERRSGLKSPVQAASASSPAVMK